MAEQASTALLAEIEDLSRQAEAIRQRIERRDTADLLTLLTEQEAHWQRVARAVREANWTDESERRQVAVALYRFAGLHQVNQMLLLGRMAFLQAIQAALVSEGPALTPASGYHTGLTKGGPRIMSRRA